METELGQVGNLKVVKKTDMGYILENGVVIVDTFAEMFSMWVGRALITAENERWACTAATVATGFASSIIMSPAEAGIQGFVSKEETPDKRLGVLVHFYHRTRPDLKSQMILRIGQCVMTCPTTAAYDALPNAKRHLKVGRSIRLFGDGYQRRDTLAERNVWRIPVMEGEFVVEDTFGASRAIAGGNILIMATNRESGLKAAEEAVEAIQSKQEDVIMPFPGGICRSGSKAGSQKYKLNASTFHQYCPRLRRIIPDSRVPEGVRCVYDIVINGLTLEAIKKAMGEGIRTAVRTSGVVMISSGNYGGRLGPYQATLKEALEL